MNMISVSSSSIRKVGHNGSTLAVLFHTSDTIYKHPRVPFVLFLRLLQAESPGTFYNQNIRGRFK